MTMALSRTHWPFHDEDEIEAVNSVLRAGRTNYWTGNEGRQFEKEFAAFVGTDYAVALMNGTVALEAALFALDIGPDDEVITTSRTFIASASCIVMRGATPVIADVDPETQNITAETIQACITPRTKAIIVVHLAGWPADMPAIMALAKQYHLRVIEDCAQAHGAMLDNQSVGSFGDIGAFSFCQDKIMTTGGEGGMITTRDKKIWEKIWSFKDHGKDYEKACLKSHPPGFRWLHDSFGTNWRMTEMQAAIGRIQLKKLSIWRDIRNQFAQFLNKKLASVPGLRLTIPPSTLTHAYYKYYVFVIPEKLKPGWSRDKIIEEMNRFEVPCLSGSCSEIYLEQAFQRNKKHDILPKPIAKWLGDTSLMLLVHPTLTHVQINEMADTLKMIMQEAVHQQELIGNSYVI